MKRKFFNYVIPSVTAMWIFSLYTMADGIFVAKGVGEAALAAVNICMPYVNVTFAMAILFAIGTSTIASIHLGRKEIQDARKVFSMNITVLAVLCVTISVLCLMNLERVAYFLGATEMTIGYVKDYLGIIAIFSGFSMMSYYMEVLVKTDGFPKLATLGVCVSAVTNIVLDYIFVIKLGFGVKGAAVATGISQVLSCSIFLVHFIVRKTNITFAKFKFDLSVIKRAIPIGVADFLTELSTGFIIFMFNRVILKNIGESGIITYTVIMYVSNLVIMTMAGISQGTQPLVSYYYGRDDKKTYAYFLKLAVRSVIVMAVVIYVGCTLFAEQINALFINPDETQLFEYSVRAFRLYVPAYLILGFNIVLIGFYSAIEKPKYSMIVSSCRGFFVITVTLMLMSTVLGETGIWMTSAVSEAVCLIINGVIFVKFFFRELFGENKLNVSIGSADD